MKHMDEIREQRAANAAAIREAEAVRTQCQESFLTAKAEKRGAEVVRGFIDEMNAAEVKRIAAEYNAAVDAYNALAAVDGFEDIRRI